MTSFTKFGWLILVKNTVLAKMNIHKHRTKQRCRSYTFQPLMRFCGYSIVIHCNPPGPLTTPSAHLLFYNSSLSLPRKQWLLVHLGSFLASAPKILPPYICKCNLFYHFRRAVDHSVIWQTCTRSGLVSKERK